MAASSFDDESEHFAQRDYTKPYPVPALRVVPTYPSVTERYFDVRFFLPHAHVAENKNAGDQCILFHTNRICMITLAPHHPLLPNNYFGIERVTKNSEIASSSSTSNESNVNPFDPLSWQSFIADASRRTIESIDFTNGTTLNSDQVTTSRGETGDQLANGSGVHSSPKQQEQQLGSSSQSQDAHPAPHPHPAASSAFDSKFNAQKHNRLLNTVTGKRKKGGQKLKERSIICQVKCTDGSVFSILAGIKGTLVEINEALLTQPNLLIDEPWSRGYIAIILTRITRVNRLKDLLTSSDEYYKEVALRKCKMTNESNESNKWSNVNSTRQQATGQVTNESIIGPISDEMDQSNIATCVVNKVKQQIDENADADTDAGDDDVTAGTRKDLNDDEQQLDMGNLKKLKC